LIGVCLVCVSLLAVQRFLVDEMSSQQLTEEQQRMLRRMMQERRNTTLSSSSSGVASSASRRCDPPESDAIMPHKKPRQETSEESDERLEDNDNDEDFEDVESLDRQLARDMNELSMEERQNVMQMIHGLEGLQEETPEFLEERLNALQIALDYASTTNEDREAYNLAVEIDASYVQNTKFRLKFLRCELWNAELAAKRLLKYMKTKMELFGRELLCKKICQEDLPPQAQRALMEGGLQHMPVRDSRGRLVTLMMHDLVDISLPLEPLLQRAFYMSDVHAEDENIQRNGAVFIIWKKTKKFNRSVAWRSPRILGALPVRQTAIHVCFDASLLVGIDAFVKYACSKMTRVLVKIHRGSTQEIKYALMTYGIPVEYLPISSDGGCQLLPGHARKWVARRYLENQQRAKDQASRERTSMHRATASTSFEKDEMRSAIESPTQYSGSESLAIAKTTEKASAANRLTDNDVLLGRGKSADTHPGNILFRQLIDERRSRYDEATRKNKTAICKEIIQLIHDRNGRFLQNKQGSSTLEQRWQEVDAGTARSKVANCFRSFRRNEKRNSSRESSSVSTGVASSSETSGEVRRGDSTKPEGSPDEDEREV